MEKQLKLGNCLIKAGELCDSPFYSKKRLGLFILLSIETGLQASEVLSLKIENFKNVTEGKLIRLNKSGAVRTVFIGSISVPPLEELIKEMKQLGQTYLFTSSKVNTTTGGSQRYTNRWANIGLEIHFGENVSHKTLQALAGIYLFGEGSSYQKLLNFVDKESYYFNLLKALNKIQ